MILIAALFVSVAFIVLSTARWRWHPFLALLAAAFGFALLARMPLDKVADAVNTGFGETVGKIGIVIIAGTIIGEFLERSGGAFAVAERILTLTGRQRVPLAMTLIGYVISIPVFCDSGFVIISPLNRALSKRAGITLAASAIALGLGLYTTHTMVPPTPGPIAAAGILNADIGLVMLFGLLVAAVALVPSVLFATRIASRVQIDPAPELSDDALSERLAQAPSAALSLLPIAIPLILILGKSIADLPSQPAGSNSSVVLLRFLGHPVVALLCGVILAVFLPRQRARDVLSTTGWAGQAVIKAAPIIIITGAGGAFGKVLQSSELSTVVNDTLGNLHLGIWLPIIIAAALKTAQGSSTVAIITTASMMAPLMEGLGYDSTWARALVVVAIGAGSMIVSHANDSYFWVVTQFSSMDVKTGYKLHTGGSVVAGLAAALALWLLSVCLI